MDRITNRWSRDSKPTSKDLDAKQSQNKWNTEILNNELIQNNFKEAIEEKLTSIDARENVVQPEINVIWKELRECITEVAENICGTTKAQKKQPWITIEIMHKMEERRKAKQQPSNTKKYKMLCKEIRKECKKAKEKYYSDKCKELEELDAKHSPRLFTKLKELKERKNNAKSGLRNKDGQIIQDEDNILKRWHEYTTELYSNDRGKVPKIDVDEEAQKVPYIPETEILKAITQLPKNKAVGEDNIPAEFLQCLGEKGKEKIITIINKIYQNGEIPAHFLKSIFIPYQKQLTQRNAKNTEL